MNYIGIALIKHDGCEKPYLFQYPAFMTVRAGMLARVLTHRGESIGTVIWSDDVQEGSEEYHGMLIASGVANPASLQPILAVAEWRVIAWENIKESEDAYESCDPDGTGNG